MRISYPGRSREWGFAISQQSGQFTNTGQLGRRTLLHKRYHIQRVIGRGGMGAVYQAKDLKRQATCAIKEMSLSMVPPEEREQAIQNFKIEAKILWGLNHPNLPAFTGFFSENQRYFMVMEYIDGYTLEDLLERNGGPFPERRVLGWARQLCDVLEYLHSLNPPIIFRDMKPGNIMLTRTGRIKLIDFGIARFFRSTSAQDTQLLGTPGFAPPEQYGRAQTDERSDIYSLAITLFQLLTNTLSETGFGLKDVRSVNSHISPVVARALEKAASLSAEDRYSNVAEFRRALFGIGTFHFDNGEQATTAEELARLCARYPDEAADYLADGEIELWLREIGEADLAQVAQHIRAMAATPQALVEQFLEAVLGPKAHIGSYSSSHISSKTSVAVKPLPAQSNRSWFFRKAPPLQVSPHTLDFGEVYTSISAPLSMMIMGDQGLHITGTLHTNEPWITLDKTRFDGMITRVNVRVNSMRVQGSKRITGSVIISPDDNTQKDIVVAVKADMINYRAQNNGFRRRGGKTIGADLDDDDDEDLTPGSISAINAAAQKALANTLDQRDTKYHEKYGSPGAGWKPVQVSAQQKLRIQWGRIFSMALMAASLIYTFVSQLPPLKDTTLLPLSEWFIVVLAGIVPAATLGALLINLEANWSLRNLLNRACAGMGGSLLTLSIFKVVWQLLFHMQAPLPGLIAMLLVTSLAATVCTHPTSSDYIIYGVSWLLSRARWPIITLTTLIGGGLGFLLTTDFAFSPFTCIGILLGMGVAALLAWRVDFLMKQHATTS